MQSKRMMTSGSQLIVEVADPDAAVKLIQSAL
jgi:hypothetical protein